MGSSLGVSGLFSECQKGTSAPGLTSGAYCFWVPLAPPFGTPVPRFQHLFAFALQPSIQTKLCSNKNIRNKKKWCKHFCGQNHRTFCCLKIWAFLKLQILQLKKQHFNHFYKQQWNPRGTRRSLRRMILNARRAEVVRDECKEDLKKRETELFFFIFLKNLFW